MAFGLNRAEVIGRLGADVTVNHLTNGGRVANISVATDESYIDRNGGGERVDKTEWHRCVTFQDGLIDMLERHAKKGRLDLCRGQDADPALAQGRRGHRPVLHRDPAGARIQDPVFGQGQRHDHGGRPGTGERRHRSDSCRGRRRGSNPVLIRYLHPISHEDRRCGAGLHFCRGFRGWPHCRHIGHAGRPHRHDRN